MRIPVILYHGPERFVLGDAEVEEDGTISRTIVNETCGTEFWKDQPHLVVVLKGQPLLTGVPIF